MLNYTPIFFATNEHIPLSADCEHCRFFQELCSGSVYTGVCESGQVEDMQPSHTAKQILDDTNSIYTLARLFDYNLPDKNCLEYADQIEDWEKAARLTEADLEKLREKYDIEKYLDTDDWIIEERFASNDLERELAELCAIFFESGATPEQLLTDLPQLIFTHKEVVEQATKLANECMQTNLSHINFLEFYLKAKRVNEPLYDFVREELRLFIQLMKETRKVLQNQPSDLQVSKEELEDIVDHAIPYSFNMYNGAKNSRHEHIYNQIMELGKSL